VTDRHTLDDSDRKEMQTTLDNILAQVRKRGGSGRLIDVNASEHADVPTLIAELEIDRPEFMWVRQVKFKRSGCDHTLGLYVKSQEKRESLAAAFAAFAANYRTVGPAWSLGR
jgi:hypothetical protein